jgi:hypothetical protein
MGNNKMLSTPAPRPRIQFLSKSRLMLPTYPRKTLWSMISEAIKITGAAPPQQAEEPAGQLEEDVEDDQADDEAANTPKG